MRFIVKRSVLSSVLLEELVANRTSQKQQLGASISGVLSYNMQMQNDAVLQENGGRFDVSIVISSVSLFLHVFVTLKSKILMQEVRVPNIYNLQLYSREEKRFVSCNTANILLPFPVCKPRTTVN